MSEKPKTPFKEHVKVFISTYFLALLIRTLIIEASQIPSQSMVPSLQVGDTLMVEKVSLGAYVPVLGWKLPSFIKPKVNDMIVFVSPEWRSPGKGAELITFLSLSLVNQDNTFDNPKILVKRLVAEPGDILAMTNWKLYRNKVQITGDSAGYLSQKVYMRGQLRGSTKVELFPEIDDKYKRTIQHEPNLAPYTTIFDMYKTPEFYFIKDKLVQEAFPDIRVPKKGDSVVFADMPNLYERYLWSLLISQELGKPVVFDGTTISRNNKTIETWTAKQDYYFVMGDNRDSSYDGRYFGFVPRNSIYGKPLFRYWPLNRMNFFLNINTEKALKGQ